MGLQGPARGRAGSQQFSLTPGVPRVAEPAGLTRIGLRSCLAQHGTAFPLQEHHQRQAGWQAGRQHSEGVRRGPAWGQDAAGQAVPCGQLPVPEP